MVHDWAATRCGAMHNPDPIAVRLYQRTIFASARQLSGPIMRSLLLRCLKSPKFWQLALAGYWLALFIGTHIPIARLASDRGSADKFVHVAAFALLSILLAITWRVSAGRLQRRELISIWVIVVLYGALEETTQPLMSRTASLVDWFADGIGAALGLTIYRWFLDRWMNRLITDSEDSHLATRSWPRYSLKSLLVAMTITALVCYWMLLPTMNAQRFVRALQEKDYGTAESQFRSEELAFPGTFKSYDRFVANAIIAPLTWDDLWKGERRIKVAIDYGNDGGLIGCAADITAYRDGLKLGPIVP